MLGRNPIRFTRSMLVVGRGILTTSFRKVPVSWVRSWIQLWRSFRLIRPVCRVLEIGCGMGRLFEGLSLRFAEVWGIDISESMIEQGRAQCPVEARWILGDGVTLKGVESESIDHALSYEVFGHVPRPSIIRTYFTEIRRVLRPGGTFQAQLHGGSDSIRQAIVRGMPRPLRVASAAVVRTLGVLPVQGDIDSWLGCIVPPDEALSILTEIGFVDNNTFNSDFIGVPRGSPVGYWVLGRKPTDAGDQGTTSLFRNEGRTEVPRRTATIRPKGGRSD